MRRVVALVLLASCSACTTSSPTGPGGPDAGADTAQDANVGTPSLVDAGLDASPDANLGPTPLSVLGPKLTQWLYAGTDKFVFDSTPRLKTWIDSSPNHRDAVAMYVSDSGRLDVVPGALGLHAALRFRGAETATGVLTAPFGSTSKLLLTVVVAYSGTLPMYLSDAPARTGGRGPILLANVEGSTRILGTLNEGAPAPPAGPRSVAEGLNDSLFHIVTLRSDYASKRLTLRVDGVESEELLAEPVLEGYPVVGGRYYPTGSQNPERIGYPLDGMIAEVVRADTAGTPAELAGLAAYFKAKYGLTF